MSGKYYHPLRTVRTREIIAKCIAENPKVTTGELSKITKIGSSVNILYHIRRLEAAGLVHWEGARGKRTKATQARQSSRWQRGDVKLPKLSKERQAELIEQVVRKAEGSGRKGEEEPNEDVIRGFGHRRLVHLTACKVG